MCEFWCQCEEEEEVFCVSSVCGSGSRQDEKLGLDRGIEALIGPHGMVFFLKSPTCLLHVCSGARGDGDGSPPSATGSDPRSPIAGRLFKLSARFDRDLVRILLLMWLPIREAALETTLQLISSQLTWTWTLFFVFQVDTAPGTALRFLEMPSLMPETVGSMLSSVCASPILIG
ncbi:NAC domain-containing protein 21 [Musa troglodytarum]|uniref:NAC domain-containing protein 21 n=1 Tax=Musa troglodytarum TaxID=320322 RepID=A0A9E7HQ62_9LILI|nr:NAC domain-containing protein 21 [Musa troglodytarum]